VGKAEFLRELTSNWDLWSRLLILVTVFMVIGIFIQIFQWLKKHRMEGGKDAKK